MTVKKYRIFRYLNILGGAMSEIILMFTHFFFMYDWLSIGEISSLLTVLSQIECHDFEKRKDIQKSFLGQYFDVLISTFRPVIDDVQRMTQVFKMLNYMFEKRVCISIAFNDIIIDRTNPYDNFGFYKPDESDFFYERRDNTVEINKLFQPSSVGNGEQSSIGSAEQLSIESEEQDFFEMDELSVCEGSEQEYKKPFTYFQDLYQKALILLNKFRQELTEIFLSKYEISNCLQQTTQIDYMQYDTLCLEMHFLEFMYNIMFISLAESKNPDCTNLTAIRYTKLQRSAEPFFQSYLPFISTPYPYVDVFKTFCKVNSLFLWQKLECFQKVYKSHMETFTFGEFMKLKDVELIFSLTNFISNSLNEGHLLKYELRPLFCGVKKEGVHGIDFLKYNGTPYLFPIEGFAIEDSVNLMRDAKGIYDKSQLYHKLKPFLRRPEGICPCEIQSGRFFIHDGFEDEIYCLQIGQMFENYFARIGTNLPKKYHKYIGRKLTEFERNFFTKIVPEEYSPNYGIPLKGTKLIDLEHEDFLMYPCKDYDIICEIIELIINYS